MANSTIAEKIAQAESERQRIVANIAAAYDEAEAKGATMPATENSANLADRIDSISQGRDTEVEPKYVNFIDVDGTRLYSYTEAEIQSLSALPQLPTREGYTYQSWNWTLSEILAYGFPLTVGAVRVPSDGKTHLTFDLYEGDDLTLSIPFYEETGREISIDWGDGTSGVYTTSPAEHIYAGCGRYTVCADSNNYFIPKTPSNIIRQRLSKAEFGVRSKIQASCCIECHLLRLLTIPEGITQIESSAFSGCSSLPAVVIPASVEAIRYYAFADSNSLHTVAFPGGTLWGLDDSAFAYDRLHTVSLPQSVTEIKSYVFRNNPILQFVALSPSIQKLNSGVFVNNRFLKSIDLSALTTVPVVETNTFFSISDDAVFYVRNAAMLSAFQSATNWSAFASKMQIGGKYAES